MILNNRGIGLLEMTVAGGLLAGLLVTVMKVNESGIKGAAKFEKRTDIVYLDQEVSSYLGDSRSCINSIGYNVVELTSFTGLGKANFTKVHNRDNVLVFPIPHLRGSVSLKQMYLTDYQATLKTARLFREYEYQVSKERKEIKTFVGEVAISDLAGRVVGCVLKASAGGDGPWIVEPDSISYSGGTVGIGTSTPAADLHVMKSGGPVRLAVHNPEEFPVYFELAGTGGVNGVEGLEIAYNNDGNTFFRNRWAGAVGGHMYFETAAAGTPVNAMTLLQNGNVGINSLTPLYGLQVERTNLAGGNGWTALFREGPTSSGVLIGTRGAGAGTASITGINPALTAGSNLSLNPFDGNVGIGTLSPRAKLDVYGGYLRVGNSVTNPNEGGQIILDDGTGSGTWSIDSMGPDGAEVIRFFRDGGETNVPSVLVIAPTGNVGIGTESPGAKLDIAAGVSTGVRVVGPYPTTILSESDTGTSFWTVVDGSTYQVRLNGYATSLMSLDASGNLWISGAYSPSDRRLKEDVTTLRSPLHRLLQIAGVNYRWKPEVNKSSELQLGVIAQDVEKVFPEAVLINKDGTKGVNYGALIAPVIEALRELNSTVIRVFTSTETHAKEIKAIKEQNKELKKANEQMMARMDRMEKMLLQSRMKNK